MHTDGIDTFTLPFFFNVTTDTNMPRFLINLESESGSSVSDPLRSHGLYTVRGSLEARILEWVAIPFSRGSSQTRDQTQVSRILGGFFTV